MINMFTDWLSVALILAAAGVFGGFLAGLFGIGGGLIIVPTLYFVLQWQGVATDLAMTMAVQTSLISIIFTSLSSLRAHHKLNNVDWQIAKVWLPATVVGALLGGMVVSGVRSNYLIILFSLLLLSVAIYRVINPDRRASNRSMPSRAVQRFVAASIGLLSVCVGVGGGATSVPALLFMGVNIHRAIGTSAALGFAIAFPGSIAILALTEGNTNTPPGSLGLIYLPALVFLLPFTVLCAPLGAKYGKRLRDKTLNTLFAFALFIIAAKMLFSVLG